MLQRLHLFMLTRPRLFVCLWTLMCAAMLVYPLYRAYWLYGSYGPFVSAFGVLVFAIISVSNYRSVIRESEEWRASGGGFG